MSFRNESQRGHVAQALAERNAAFRIYDAAAEALNAVRPVVGLTGGEGPVWRAALEKRDAARAVFVAADVAWRTAADRIGAGEGRADAT